MSVEKDFIFDVIVNKMSFDEQTYFLKELSVKINFADINLDITSSRMDVTDFLEGRSCTFKSTTESLKKKLSDNPMQITVMRESEVLGEAIIEWPEQLLERLCDENFVSHSHVEEKELKKNGDKIGYIIIILKIQCKCKEDLRYSADESLADDCGRLKIGDEMERVIDPNDILFVIGETPVQNYGKNALGQCSYTKCPARLDVSRYKNVKGRLVHDISVVGPCGNLDCSGIKCGDDECNEIIREICGKQEMPIYCLEKNEMLCDVPKFSNKKCDVLQERMCKAQTHVTGCPHRKQEKKWREEDHQCSDSITTTETETDIEDPLAMCPPVPCPSKPKSKMPELKATCTVRPKCCPICLEDISWLPKFAACAKCGYKAMPYELKERLYDENLTADGILAEWGANIQALEGCSGLKKKPKNRCTCQIDSKPCAYCRIKNMFKNVIKLKKPSAYFGQCRSDLQSFGSENQKELNILDLSEAEGQAGDKDNIPHLTKTLQELKAKFGVGIESRGKLYSDEQSKYAKLNEFCERELQRPDKKHQKNKQNMSIKNNNKLDLRFKKGFENRDNKTKKLSKKENTNLTGKRKKNKHRCLYSAYKNRPLLAIRHQDCIGEAELVPKHMGWLWTLNDTAKKGWTPGAIRKPIKVLMKHFLRDFPTDNLGISKYHDKSTFKKIEEEMLVQKPTLHITKKNGEYLVTMRPLKDPKQLEECATPYARVKPIQFKICKNPMVVYKRNIKKLMKQRGFKKCCCGNTISCCHCRTFVEKKKLECEVSKVCEKLKIPDLSDTLVLSDTSETGSELDVEFTPPVGLIKPILKRKPDYACKETQYVEDDYKIKEFIKKKNKFVKPLSLTEDRGRFGNEKAQTDEDKRQKGGLHTKTDKEKNILNGKKDGKKYDKNSNKSVKASKEVKEKGRLKTNVENERGKHPKRNWPVLGNPPPLICMVKHKRSAVDPCACFPPPANACTYDPCFSFCPCDYNNF